MKTITRLATAAIALSLTAAAAGAGDFDWIESVSIEKHGIDTAVIDVRANGNGYYATKQNTYDLHLMTKARATSGERIVGLKLSSPYSRWGESSNGRWEYFHGWNDTGAGQLRTVAIDKTYRTKLSDLMWLGDDPVAKCNTFMAYQQSQGYSKATTLSKTHKLTATVAVGVSAVAMRKGQAKPIGPRDMPADWKTFDQGASMKYKVQVRCMAAPNHLNQVAAPATGKSRLRLPAKILGN